MIFKDGHLYYTRQWGQVAIIAFCYVKVDLTKEEQSETPRPINIWFLAANFDWGEPSDFEPYFQSPFSGFDVVREIQPDDLFIYSGFSFRGRSFSEMLNKGKKMSVREIITENKEDLSWRTLM